MITLPQVLLLLLIQIPGDWLTVDMVITIILLLFQYRLLVRVIIPLEITKYFQDYQGGVLLVLLVLYDYNNNY